VDKSWKLQRYSKKDYSEVVDFPVEIVGRDGVVRRYSFEDSVRLYQRRVTFAPIRYHDADLVDAEVSHCRARIEQLRRSFFHRFGWGTPEGQLAPTDCFGEFAGELAAFFRRVLQSEGRPDVQVLPLGDWDGPTSTWYVRPNGMMSGMLLYWFHLDGGAAEALRERFFETLKMLERTPDPEADCERLLAFHHTGDCGMILTARAGEFAELEGLKGVGEEPEDLSTPWDEVADALRRGDHADACVRCRDLVEDQPYHRRAYLTGAVLALGTDQPHEAEDFALVGSRYFPDDALMRFYVALARDAQGRGAEVDAELVEALNLNPGLAIARLYAVVRDVRAGRYGAARVRLGSRAERSRDRSAEIALDRVEQWLRWRRVMGVGANTSLGLGVAATLLGGLMGLVPVALGFGMASLGTWVFRRQFEQLVARHLSEDVAQGLRRVQRAVPDPSPQVS
jgi:hypothetical protein